MKVYFVRCSDLIYLSTNNDYVNRLKNIKHIKPAVFVNAFKKQFSLYLFTVNNGIRKYILHKKGTPIKESFGDLFIQGPGIL